MRKTVKNKKRNWIYIKYGKRVLDIMIALCGMIVVIPAGAVVSLLVLIFLGSPVIFKQERPGLNEKPFYLYKFRTMTDKRDEEGNLLPDEQRLTKFGKFLRATSLDEFPEFINILKGDMSFVGPRPLLMEYLPLYNKRQKHRHDVRPGLTGLAQVRGRNAISWEEKFEYDLKYIQHISLRTDICILVETVKTVLKRDGIHSKSSVTMEKFKGEN